jgi:hypothetical protein
MLALPELALHSLWAALVKDSFPNADDLKGIAKMPSREEAAELLALQALGWLAGNDEVLPQFLSASGASLGDLPGAAQDPAFLASVLDFLLNDDAWVIGFCDATGHKYTEPLAARAFLPGGQATHWT